MFEGIVQSLNSIAAALPTPPPGAWTTFSPSWTNLTVGAGGTNNGSYIQIGKTVICRFYFKYGTGSSVGTGPTFAPPVLPASVSFPVMCGTMYIEDAAVSGYYGSVLLLSTTAIQPIMVTQYSTTYAGTVALAATVPHSWGTNDFFSGTIMYEAA